MSLFQKKTDDRRFLVTFEINNEKSALIFDSSKNAVEYINMIITQYNDSLRNVRDFGQGKYLIEFYGGLSILIEVIGLPKSMVKYHLIKVVDDEYIETRRFTNLLSVFNFVKKEIRKIRKFFFVASIGMGEWTAKKDGHVTKYYLSVAVITKELVDKVMEVVDEVPAEDEYYEILEIDRTATEEDVKKAYRKKSKKVHPDFGGSAEEFKRVNEAYRKVLQMVHSKVEGSTVYNKHMEVAQVEVESAVNYPCVDILTLLRRSEKTVWNFLRDLIK